METELINEYTFISGLQHNPQKKKNSLDRSNSRLVDFQFIRKYIYEKRIAPVIPELLFGSFAADSGWFQVHYRTAGA